MGTEIKTWQIIDGKLTPINTDLKTGGRNEPYDLEPWLVSNPKIIGDDIIIIGRQVPTKSGFIDLLGIDKSGNTVIIEIKRNELPRECLAQAIDYASDVFDWSSEKLGTICSDYTNKPFIEVFSERFSDVVPENLTLNSSQRIVLVGFVIGSSLERMIEWLSDSYAVNINAIILSYAKTAGGEELLTRTSIISEEVEQERNRGRKKFEIPMSDEAGTHDEDNLKHLFLDYLSKDKVTNQRLRDIFLPACLKREVVTRDQLKKEFVDSDFNYDESKVGYYLTLLSSQLGMKKNDFLRQIISYEYPRHPWEKDNFSIREQYRNLVKDILDEIKGQ